MYIVILKIALRFYDEEFGISCPEIKARKALELNRLVGAIAPSAAV